MPRVPTYDSPVVKVETARPTYSSLQAPSGLMVTRGLAILGDAVQEVEDRHLAAVVASYDSQASEYTREAWGRLSAIKGKDALEAAPKAVAELDKLIAQNEQTVPQRARDAYRRVMQQRRAQFATIAERHAQAEGDQYASDQFRASVENAVADGAQFATDPAARALALSRMEGALAVRAKTEGWSPEARDAARRESLTRFHTGVVSALAASDPEAAARYASENAPFVAPAGRERIDAASVRQRSLSSAREIQAKFPGDLQAQYTAAKEIGDAALQDAVNQRLGADWQDREQARAAVMQPRVDRLMLDVERNGRLDRQSRDYLDLDDRARVLVERAYDAELSQRRATFNATEALRQQERVAAGQEARARMSGLTDLEWAGLTPDAFVGEVDKETLNWIVTQKREAARRIDATSGRNGVPLQKLTAFVRGEVASLGLEKEDVSRLGNEMTTWALDRAQQTKAPPTPDEIRAELGKKLIYGKVGMFGKSYAFKAEGNLTPLPAADQPYAPNRGPAPQAPASAPSPVGPPASITADERAKIVAALNRARQPVTEAAIAALWARKNGR